eukprot:13077490-Alexandrium_andersonii.AAC.1
MRAGRLGRRRDGSHRQLDPDRRRTLLLLGRLSGASAVEAFGLGLKRQDGAEVPAHVKEAV